jgi:thymidylate synthase
MIVFTGENPSELYLKALYRLKYEGRELAPRGKRILELRPVIFEFINPLNRTTFIEGRSINPFFQLAESLWILSGRADVEPVSLFNSNIGQFSDDGKYFNAPYGERLRFWGRSTLREIDRGLTIIDQLNDVHKKLSNDQDSRQAVAVIYNPDFDNSNYTSKGGKDQPCNLVLLFKIRDNKLDMTVLNRSNDIHWGLFGANLCQFSTILEYMACWLGVEAGTYYHITDSLHVYLDNYGSSLTDKIFKANPEGSLLEPFPVYPDEPRMRNHSDVTDSLHFLWENIYDSLKDKVFLSGSNKELINASFLQESFLPDPYIRDSVAYMFVYQAYKAGNQQLCIDLLQERPASQWKKACLNFLKPRMEGTPLFSEFCEACLED